MRFMKVDILDGPPGDIFQNRRKYIILFVVLIIFSACGLLIGLYTMTTNTLYYEQFELAALVFFVAPSPFVFYFGEKLQGYKKLTPPQWDELKMLAKEHLEIKNYCDQVEGKGRRPVRAEFEACQAWAEDRQHKTR